MMRLHYSFHFIALCSIHIAVALLRSVNDEAEGFILRDILIVSFVVTTFTYAEVHQQVSAWSVRMLGQIPPHMLHGKSCSALRVRACSRLRTCHYSGASRPEDCENRYWW